MLPLAVPWAANGLPAIRRPLGPAEADWLLYTQVRLTPTLTPTLTLTLALTLALTLTLTRTLTLTPTQTEISRAPRRVAGAFGSSAVVGLDPCRKHPEHNRTGQKSAGNLQPSASWLPGASSQAAPSCSQPQPASANQPLGPYEPYFTGPRFRQHECGSSGHWPRLAGASGRLQHGLALKERPPERQLAEV